MCHGATDVANHSKSKRQHQRLRSHWGRLTVSAGVWLTGPIILKDNIDLHVEKNAIVLFSADKKLYVRTDPKTGKVQDKCVPALNVSKRRNVSITGEGIIDGNGEWWRPVKRAKVSDTEWNAFKAMGGTEAEGGKLWFPFKLKHYDDIASTPEAQESSRADLIRITECENVLVKGVTIQNSPRFHLHPVRSTSVTIDGVTVRCPWNAQNGDAIDISNCRKVLIVNNVIDAGDDGICMKGGIGKSGVEGGPCEDILIQDNTVYHAHGGFVIGSDMSGGMKDIVVRKNTFAGTDTGLRFKSSVGRGGKTEGIYISDIYMTDIKDEAIVFETTYTDRKYAVGKTSGAKTVHHPTAPFTPQFDGIRISHVVCHGAETGIAAHGAEGTVSNVLIENSVIFYTGKAADIDQSCGVKTDNVKFVTY